MTIKEQKYLYKTYYRRLYNISFRILSDSVQAEEVMHDTLLKYMSRPQRLDSEAQESAWLSRTCIRASIDLLRRRRREQLFLQDYSQVLDEDFDQPLDEDDEDMSGISASEIVRQIQQMKSDDSLILNLVLIEELKYSEISQMTGESEGNLRIRFFRARKKLAQKLGHPLKWPKN